MKKMLVIMQRVGPINLPLGMMVNTREILHAPLASPIDKEEKWQQLGKKRIEKVTDLRRLRFLNF